MLFPPCIQDPLSSTLRNKIAICLSTRFDQPVAYMHRYMRTAVPIFTQYAKVRFVNGGDIVHASKLAPSGEDRRDASFVRVSMHIYTMASININIVTDGEYFCLYCSIPCWLTRIQDIAICL